MPQTKLNLEAEIVPMVGLGGLRLGAKVRDCQEIIDEAVTRWKDEAGKVPYELASPFEARYQVGGGTVEIAVDVGSGTVVRLSAFRGYEGTFDGKIRVGMRVGDATKLDERLHYSKDAGAVVCEGVPGIRFEIPMADAPISIVPDQIICAMTVTTD